MAKNSTQNDKPRGPSGASKLLAGLLTLALLVACAVAAAAVWWVWRAEEEVRRRVHSHLAQAYPALQVEVRAARLVAGQVIEVRGVSLVKPGSRDEGPRQLLLIDELFITAPTDPKTLLAGAVPIEKLHIRRARLKAYPAADGRWSLADLRPTVGASRGRFAISVVNSAVELTLPGAAEPLELNVDRLEVIPAAVAAQSVYEFQASLRTATCPSLAVSGQWDEQTGAWQAEVAAKGARLSPDALRMLERATGQPLAPVAQIRGSVAVQAALSGKGLDSNDVHVQAHGQLRDGRLVSDQIPYPITEVALDWRLRVADGAVSLSVPSFSCRAGEGRVTGFASLPHLDSGGHWEVTVNAQDVRLDPRLESLFPVELRRQWVKFQPAGAVDLHLHARHENGRWKPQVEMALRDVAFTFCEAPYLLKSARGRLTYADHALSFNVECLAGESPVSIRGELTDPGPTPRGLVEIHTEAPIAIDDQLLAAMPSDAAAAVARFQAHGEIAVDARVKFTGDPAGPEIEEVLTVSDATIRHVDFPYPITNIHGVIERTGTRFRFHDFEGRNDSGYITASGELRSNAGRHQLSLQLLGSDISLEDELRTALDAGLRRQWERLRPRGAIDQLAVELHWQSGMPHPDVEVRAQQWATPEDTGNRRDQRRLGISVEPAWLPIRIEIGAGAAHYAAGRLDLTGVSGRYGKTQLSCEARAALAPDGSWRVSLGRIVVDSLEISREVLAAAPSQLASVLTELNIQGPVFIDGAVTLAGRHDDDRIAAGWDLTVDMEDGSIRVGSPLTHVHGGVRLVGRFEDDRVTQRGELAVDSVIFRGLQLSGVRGPIAIEPDRLILGRWVEPNRGEPLRPVTAKLFGGELRGDLRMALTGDHPFTLQASLTGGDLKAFALERLGGADNLRGEMQADLRLSGTAAGMHTARGGGVLRLRNADTYELPVMLAMLKTLSIRKPDRTAFSAADIDYRLEGDHIYLDKIDFHGDVLSFRGEGSVSLAGAIDSLQFFTFVDSAPLNLPIIKPVLGEASRQLLAIRVSGSLHEPRLSRQALPGITETIERLFPNEFREARQARQQERRIFPEARRILSGNLFGEEQR